jgi:penicillin G amidase
MINSLFNGKLLMAAVTLTMFFVSCQSADQDNAEQMEVLGLQEDVEIIRDEWGINHIYANNQHDLFFAQGYAAARDRLFQFEVWRRQANGTVAEMLGKKEIERDIGTRLFKFRGDIKEEMAHYHPEGVEIITAFVDGVNAYIAEANTSPENLPRPFRLLGIEPKPWTPEIVVSRHQGLLGNINRELNTGRAVALAGEEVVEKINWFHPKNPDLTLDPAIDGELLFNDVIAPYQAFRQRVRFGQDDLSMARLEKEKEQMYAFDNPDTGWGIGSNNWIVSGSRTASGNTHMANDPHRTVAVPSLRYMAHLVAPGWNVIGGGEPEIPGISIGHNEYGAWGLTVFRTDGEDLYVYELNPENPHEYKYQGEFETMEKITETIPVKGQQDTVVNLYYTRHGPVTHIDSVNNVAYAMRCAWQEVGGSPYLASLRMDQAKSWEEYREACSYSHIPGENMSWADVNGNIGWQAVGIAPVRKNFSGLVPVPGDGRYEWDGYLPIKEKPHLKNPEKGYFSTANQNVTPENYNHWDAIGFSWSDPYRGMRVSEYLESHPELTVEQSQKLQTDYLSIPARKLVPLLQQMKSENTLVTQAQAQMLDWDFRLLPNSVAAAIYVSWENRIRDSAEVAFIPENIRPYVSLQLKRIIDWVENPDRVYEENARGQMTRFLVECFELAVADLQARLGDNISNWQYGQADYKHITIQHALGDTDSSLNLGPLPRGGNGYTPGSTGNNLNQSSGATFRMVVDVGNWDATIGTNAPGQSGDPDSPFYDNLFEPWANDEFFPVYYSRQKIEEAAATQQVLLPAVGE